MATYQPLMSVRMFNPCTEWSLYIGPSVLTTFSPTLSYIWFSVIRKLGSDNSTKQQQPFGL